MSAEEQSIKPAETVAAAADASATTPSVATEAAPNAEQERSEKILKAKELYSHGSRNLLVKSYTEAADELSQVCSLYEELYGELSDELGMPYLLYAKSLIALALDENKIIDVPDEEEDDDDDADADAEEDEAAAVDDNAEAEAEAEAEANSAASSTSSSAAAANGSSATKLESIKENGDEADSSVDVGKPKEVVAADKTDKTTEGGDTEVSSSGGPSDEVTGNTNGNGNGTTKKVEFAPIVDDEKPSTSNGDITSGDNAAVAEEEEEVDYEAASSLQLAWEILELAAKIFTRQGLSGLANLAEVQTELANIEFENSIMDGARDDYEKALKIYADLPTNYRRPMAEIHYKIGLTYLMQQANKEGAASLKDACSLIEAEIEAIKEKEETSEKDKNTIQDLEETKQEIWAKITEIEETQAQTIAEVRAALDSYIKPMSGKHSADGAGSSSASGSGPSSSTSIKNGVTASSSSSSSSTTTSSSSSSSSSAISSSSKPTDISHLIKRKKPDDPTSEAEAMCSPAKRAPV